MRRYYGPRIGLEPAKTAEFGLLSRTDPESFFLNSDAQTYIDAVKVTTDGLLDIEKTLDQAGVRLVDSKEELDVLVPGESMSFVSGLIHGMKPDQAGLFIYLNPDISDAERRLTCGHELAHYFLNRFTRFQSSDGADREGFVEAFCELFGREMVLGRDEEVELAGSPEETILRVMEEYQVGHMTALYFLMTKDVLPRRFTMDVGIGEAPNPHYSGKVSRRVVCMDCELRMPHHNSQDGLVSFDFTNNQWDCTTPVTNCDHLLEDPFVKQMRHRELNLQYGRWTDEDDARIPEETARGREVRLVLEEFNGESSRPSAARFGRYSFLN